jgi:NADH dehydrogenase (ubiquinone) Fe-S protein 6
MLPARCRIKTQLSVSPAFASDATMQQAPETVLTSTTRVKCDGSTDIRGGAALGHPRVWLEIDERGYVECGYCDKRFVLKDGPADSAQAA